MKREHLSAFLWLRWRIRVNQIRRAGTLNFVLSTIIGIIAAFGSVGLFFVGIAAGYHWLPNESPLVRLLVWDGAIALFLFVWMIGLMADLQRTDAISLDKVLYLPVSPKDAFLINYLSSLFSITLIMFVPGVIGLCIGQVFSIGSRMLLVLMLGGGFVFALTAVTYQFQGWMEALMANPRRRRTIVVLVLVGFIFLCQLPNLLVNVIRPWGNGNEKDLTAKTALKHQELNKQLAEGEITPEEYARRKMDIEKEISQERDEHALHVWTKIQPTVRLINTIFPPAWLALGAADLADGNFLSALFGGLGFTLIGSLSLWRAYRGALRSYTQAGSGNSRKATTTTTTANEPQSAKPRMVEWQLPWISEYTSAVAAAAMRSMIRAPEVKMFLVAPGIVLILLGGSLFSMKGPMPGFVGPFIALGVMAMILSTSMQMIVNQFGFDRDGFRAYVLSPIPRRDILLGKNIALAPLLLGIVSPVGVAATFLFHLSLDQFAAAMMQLVTMFLLFCLIGNATSIFAPFAVPAGSLKGSRPRLTIVLMQMGLMIIFPFVVGLPAFVPVIAELLLVELAKVWFPLSLLLSALVLLLTIWLYRRIITWQGRLFAEREQDILQAVTDRVE